MLKARKSIFALIIALSVIASFGIVSADQIDGMMSNNGTRLPLNVPAFAAGLSVNLDNYVNPGGLGDVLLYNYYNARKGMQTFFTVVNTSSTNGQRVRLRFREAADVSPNGQCVPEEPRGSWEVLDFDICLSANDMWSGYVTLDAAGGAKLCTFDTDTFIYDGTNGADVFPASCVPFKFGAASGLALGNITADDTLEGYFEIIGERQLVAEPLSCWPDNPPHLDSPDLVGTQVPNVLFGNAALIDSATAATYTYDATAIADFANVDIFSSPTTSAPDLLDGGDTIVGVNYILTKQRVMSVYDLIGSATEFIITEPTKALTQVCGAANDIFDDDRASFTIWNDQEQSKTTVCEFSPCPAGTDNHLPYEVNIIALNTSASLDSTVDQTISSTFTFGWFDINFTTATSPFTFPHLITVVDGAALSTTTNGWPVLGLTVLDVADGAATGTFKMQATTLITNP